MSTLAQYPNGVVAELVTFFRDRTSLLRDAGIPAEHIIIDPGIGFAKTASQSFELTRQLGDLCALNFDVLYGASMKSFLGRALGEASSKPAPVNERAVATTVATTWAILQGADIVRVHDVKAAVQARRILDCIRQPWEVEDAA
jgi:dihydropteroate synthase